jgi:ribosomal protein L11 methyltransferase
VTWHAVSVAGACAGQFAELLFRAGAAGIQEEDAERLTAYYPSRELAAAVVAELQRERAGISVAMAALPEVDWASEWRRHIQPCHAGRLTIVPPWLAPDPASAEVIIIEPGMGFGTGDHPSTRGALRLLQRLTLGGALVADSGTGSGVLAIAAARLGARAVVAIESDPDALGNAQCNLELNGVQEAVSLLEGEAAVILPLVGPCDVIVSNITADVHRSLLQAYGRSTRRGGRLILAGILQAEAGDLAPDFRAQGWHLVETDLEGDWWSCMLER